MSFSSHGGRTAGDVVGGAYFRVCLADWTGHLDGLLKQESAGWLNASVKQTWQ